MQSAKWLRCRFHTAAEDYRPVKFPPPGPYWHTGLCWLDDKRYENVIAAYVRSLDQVTEYWPEATDIDVTEQDEITYTDRFPKPDWYQDD